MQRIAEAWAVLMERLGYDHYVAQGGDWGSMVSSRLAAHDPEHCAALHLNLVLGMPTDDEPDEPSATEQAAMADMATYLADADMEHVSDRSGDVPIDLGGTNGVPITFFYRAGGELAEIHLGIIDEPTMARLLDEIDR